MRESLKPIEPGCLTVVVGSLNCREFGGFSAYAGRAHGTVITVLGDADCECCVSVDRFRDVLGRGNGLPVKIRPENLIRIDPDEGQRKAWAEEERLRQEIRGRLRRLQETDR